MIERRAFLGFSRCGSGADGPGPAGKPQCSVGVERRVVVAITRSRRSRRSSTSCATRVSLGCGSPAFRGF